MDRGAWFPSSTRGALAPAGAIALWPDSSPCPAFFCDARRLAAAFRPSPSAPASAFTAFGSSAPFRCFGLRRARCAVRGARAPAAHASQAARRASATSLSCSAHVRAPPRRQHLPHIDRHGRYTDCVEVESNETEQEENHESADHRHCVRHRAGSLRPASPGFTTRRSGAAHRRAEPRRRQHAAERRAARGERGRRLRRASVHEPDAVREDASLHLSAPAALNRRGDAASAAPRGACAHLASRLPPLASRISPLASRISHLASRLSPLASRISHLASRLSHLALRTSHFALLTSRAFACARRPTMRATHAPRIAPHRPRARRLAARGSAASAAPPSLHGPARLLRRSPLPRDCLSRRVS
ncbi:hypothetical protein DP44_4940 [Burkholderia pseudomallei]|nr:hypothetical protein DP44_4940 [Burkholderia pseudomallei]